MNTIEHINLARKWRSKTFDQIVGQDLSVKMLKNSLYRGHYFPVYLFAGQRGCGKTSMARIFAAAVNCDRLVQFRISPQTESIPCLVCASCMAMTAGRHPDFIEIDAASHTGVDNVRQIVEASTLLPLMGVKKIYLIDEAHMLSKAAFNAFLKMMEEPPASVLFILATTDPHKIIETVRSRCFQVFFKSIELSSLSSHLAAICDVEMIAYQPDALELIVKETGGSARDAINLLEQVRFSSARVTKNSVQRVLGHLDDDRLLELFLLVIHHGPAQLLAFTQQHNVALFSPEFLWKKMAEITRAALWIKYSQEPQHFKEHVLTIKQIIKSVTTQRLCAMLEVFYENDLAFSKTSAQYPFFEMILLRLCQKKEGGSSSSMPAMAVPSATDVELLCSDRDEEEEGQEEDDSDTDLNDAQALWILCIKKIEQLCDPVISSVFAQGTFSNFDAHKKIVTIELPKNLLFFADTIQNAENVWQPLVHQVFGELVTLNTLFCKNDSASDMVIAPSIATAQSIHPEIKQQVSASVRSGNNFQSPKNFHNFNEKRAAPRAIEQSLDISDTQKWKMTHMLLQHFPGSVTHAGESL